MTDERPCQKDGGKYAGKLPCLSPDGQYCWGEAAWDKKRGVKPRHIKSFFNCPHIEQVRAWWRKKCTKTT